MSFQPAQIPPMPDEGFEREPYGGYDDYPNEPPMYPPGMPPSIPYPNQNSQLLQWLLNFRKETVIPLRHLWRGHELDEAGQWIEPKQLNPIMNEKGITWAISLIESYINAVYVTSNFGEEDLNWTMRQLGRVVYNNLCAKYKEFELDKLDIQRVANEIISKVHAILLGARNNGYRMFLSSTHQTHEMYSQQAIPEQKGFFSPLRNFFFKNNNP